ncbi:metallophosphoesterase [Pseudoalteromonas prydzensis]|uniref:metallophosphoesterase n=1 Tax=Pseudoalteromonas prydzensis TaxID=182141 RepID=UPI0024BC56E5|nr:metallophosphoesterase [Pseudoalteromonas prydzensis]
MLRLLHISDIHFKYPQCMNPDTDPDISIRDLFSQDIQDFAQKSSHKVDAILITGDIAFAGMAEEYEAAAKWLDELCTVIGCEPTDVYLVPGNHDIDRGVASSPTLEAIRNSVSKPTDKIERDKEVLRFLSDATSSEAIFSIMKNYNEFASRYNCELGPKKTCWRGIIKLTDNIDLSFIGMTSTLFSSANDDLHTLIIDQSQTVFRQQPGKIYLSMIHHPTDWLKDSDEIKDVMDEHINIQLFGHKHRARWDKTDRTIRVSSVSLQPERGDIEYEPGYNIIDLKEESSTKEYTDIEIKITVRTLQKSPQLFRSKNFDNNQEFFSTVIKIKNKSILISDDKGTALKQTITEEKQDNETQFYNVKKENKTVKELIYLFWGLAGSQKRKIIDELNLLSDEDWDKPEVERQKIAFKNAINDGMLDDLEKEIIKKVEDNER